MEAPTILVQTKICSPIRLKVCLWSGFQPFFYTGNRFDAFEMIFNIFRVVQYAFFPHCSYLLYNIIECQICPRQLCNKNKKYVILNRWVN